MGSITQELHPGERCSCTFLPPDLCQGVNPSDLVAEWLTPRGCLQDFGEYQESYYSVQTTEGEQISQLIAGYIDIILKKVTQTHTGQSCVQGNSTDLWTPTVTSIHHGSLSSHCACDLLSLHTSHLHLHSGSLWQTDSVIYFTSKNPSKDLFYCYCVRPVSSRSCVINGVFFCFLQKQSKDRFGLEGDEESTMLEESVSPKKCVDK